MNDVWTGNCRLIFSSLVFVFNEVSFVEYYNNARACVKVLFTHCICYTNITFSVITGDRCLVLSLNYGCKEARHATCMYK